MKIDAKIHTINKLKKCLKEIIEKKIFIISGRNSYKKSGAKKILRPILKDKIYEEYFKVADFPTIEELEIIINKIKLFSPDLILAIGGGAVMDYAKIANCFIKSKNLKKDIIDQKNYTFSKFSNLIAIPTTAGSGAEVTTNAVIYINNKKFSVENALIRPDNFFLIPDFIKKNNKNLKTSSGFDAIAQGVESLFSLKSNPESVKFALQSLKVSLKNFIPYVSSPNKSNSSRMLQAANLAGQAINISKTTAPHALSYPFTAYYKISHGHAVSLTFNEILKYNYQNLKNSLSSFDLNTRFQMLFKLTNTQNLKELDKFFMDIKKQAKLKIVSRT